MDFVKLIEQREIKGNPPAFRVGDTVKVHVKVKEGEKDRIQVFGGMVIAMKGGGTGSTFTVRKISDGIGVERIFPMHSPIIGKIEVVRAGKVRRAKLYYLRDRKGKAARVEEETQGNAGALAPLCGGEVPAAAGRRKGPGRGGVGGVAGAEAVARP